jgi:hypothetical protein
MRLDGVESTLHFGSGRLHSCNIVWILHASCSFIKHPLAIIHGCAVSHFVHTASSELQKEEGRTRDVVPD